MPVTAFDLAFRRPLAGGRAWGETGPYEELRGVLRFAIDPWHPANARITDVALAPRNGDGRVEFSADVSVLLPVDRSKAAGRMLLDVVNRGNRVALPNFNRATRPTIDERTPVDVAVDAGDGFLMRRGYVVVACGWQKDAPPYPALITLRGPDAVDPDGSPITGRVYSQLQSAVDTYNFLLSDKGHSAYPAAEMNESTASIEVRDEPDGRPLPVPRGHWRFGRIDDRGNYVPDPDYICSKEKFKKGRLYQIVYTTVGARVLGLSFAALWTSSRGSSTGRRRSNRRLQEPDTPTPTAGRRRGVTCGRMSRTTSTSTRTAGRRSTESSPTSLAGCEESSINGSARTRRTGTTCSRRCSRSRVRHRPIRRPRRQGRYTRAWTHAEVH